MEATNILSLNDDCLCHIVACINDPSSFCSLNRTCKRLQQLTSNSRNLHIDIVRSKAEYFIKRLVVYLGARYEKRGSNFDVYDEFCKLKALVDEVVQNSRTKSRLTYDTVIAVWKSIGPVASEVFKWIKNRSSSVSEGHPRATCITQERSFTVYLPKRNQEMTVATTYFHDYIGNYDDELSIEVKCGDMKIEARDFTRMQPEDFGYWDKKDVEKLVDSIKPVTKILQEELGETIPPIHAKFLFWFLYFFPEQMYFVEEEKLVFKDAAKNEKPNVHSIQTMLRNFQKNLLRGFQTASARWIEKKTFPDEAETCKFVTEGLDALVQRSDERSLRDIQRYMSRTFDVMTNYVLQKMPENLMFSLIKRTSFETDNFDSAATADKYVDNTVSFHLPGNKVIKVEGGMEGDGASYPTWHRLTLNVHLPDKAKIALDSGDIYYRRSSAKEEKMDVEKLSPVTNLLQECINKGMEGEENIPEIKDMFTAVYFITALDFGGQSESFLEDSLDISDLIVVEEDTDDSSDE